MTAGEFVAVSKEQILDIIKSVEKRTAWNTATQVASLVNLFLLVVALNVVSQHGDEFNAVRDDIQDLNDRADQIALSAALLQEKLVKMQVVLDKLNHDLTEIQRLTHEMYTNPRARPNSFTRDDFQTERDQIIEQIMLEIKNLENGR